MNQRRKLGIYLSGISCFFVGAAGFLFPLFSTPWPHVLVLLGLILVNIGLFMLGQAANIEIETHKMGQRPFPHTTNEA